MGREDKKEFGETLAQDAADCRTMGMSCILQARETPSPQKFIPPAWAYTYPDDASLPPRNYKMDRLQNYWYLELGGDRDSIGDTEEVRDELLKTAFGLWDHFKNHGDHGVENWCLDWVGFLPGKRESRRCEGDHILTEKEILSGRIFEDAVAYGGWPVDDHHPAGFNHFGPPNTNIRLKQPYTIPLRCLYSVNVENLFFAGRNISVSHVALSSSRVMATCALLGQAVGTAVFHALKEGFSTNREVAQKCAQAVRQTLLDDDCYIPGAERERPALTREAALRASAGDAEALRTGPDRELAGRSNAWEAGIGDRATYEFFEARKIREIRLAFDSDLTRDHLNMVSNYTLKGVNYAPPATLVTAFHLEADGKTFFREEANHQRFVVVPCREKASSVTLVIDALASGRERAKIFRFDLR